MVIDSYCIFIQPLSVGLYLVDARFMDLKKVDGLEFKNGVVIFGENLFLHQDGVAQQQFEYLTGNLKVSKVAIESFKENISHNKNMSYQYGFDYRHVVFPAKPVLYADEFKKIGVDINPIFGKEHASDAVIYPMLTKNDYDSDDTHTNQFGVFKVIADVLYDLGYSSLPIPILKSIESSGDLAVMCEQSAIKKKIVVGFLDYLNNTSKIERYSLAPYLIGNTGRMEFIFNPYGVINKRIVLFGDSFFGSKLNIFERLFTEVVFFRNPYVIEDVVKCVSPDIVLTENAERYLVDVPCVKDSHPWFMNYITNKFDSSKIPKSTTNAFNVLFSGRSSKIYQNNFGVKKCNIVRKLDLLRDINESEIINEADIDYIRDAAIQYENIDIKFSLKLMLLANKLRPEGPYIHGKMKEYQKKIEII